MTISTAFMEEIKRNKSVVHHVDSGKQFKVGDSLKVVGSRKKGTVSKVEVYARNGELKRVLYPVRGTQSIKTTENDILTISFEHKDDKGCREMLYLRYFFFQHDPTLFRFQSHPVIDNGNDDCCECCEDQVYVLYSMQDDGDKGGGLLH